MGLSIAPARSEEERQRILEFRYRVYVADLGLTLPDADHSLGRLTDPLDAHSVSYALLRDGQVLGEVRLTPLDDVPDPAAIVATYALEGTVARFGHAALCLSSRFVLDPRIADGTGVRRLMTKAYESARERGVRLVVTDASPHMLPFYEHLGFRRYTGTLIETSQGFRVPLLLLLGDRVRLERLRSPLVRIVPRQADDAEARTWFAETFPEYLTVESASLLPDDVFFDLLSARLAIEPLHSVALLQGFDRAEADRLLARATLIQARPGDRIVRQGDPGDALFVLLSGVAEVNLEETPDFPLALIGAGDPFGEIAFLTARRRTANVVARTKCEVIVLSAEFLTAFIAAEPVVAAKLLLNLSRVLAERLSDMNRDAAMLHRPR